MKHAFFEHGFKRGWFAGRRMRRGGMKYAVLEALERGPRHGYEIIRAVEERRGFRPSPGSIYPTLQMLEDGGFVTASEVDGKRVYTITQAGRELLTHREADEADDEEGGDEIRHRTRAAAMMLMQAVMSARGSSDATLEKVRVILDRARKEIYALLAADES